MPHYVNVALGCFFSGTSGYGGGGWSTHAFLLLRAGKALSHRRNEDGFVPYVRWVAKSVTEKNNRRVGCAEA